MNSLNPPRAATFKRDSEFSQLIKRFTTARDAGDWASALRSIDRAWRMAPENPEVNFLYGRLQQSKGEFDHAAKLFDTAVASRSYPDYEAAYISALSSTGQKELARERLEKALREFAIFPDGALAKAASQVATVSAQHCPGWIGIGPDLRFHGEIVGQTGTVKLELTGDCFAPRAHRVKCGAGRPSTAFDTPTINTIPSSHITARVHDRLLLGGKLDFPPDFGLDGRVTLSKGAVSGWVSLKWDPARPLTLTVSSDNGFSMQMVAAPDPTHLGRQLFSLTRDSCESAGNALTVSVTMPDGTLSELPASPFLIRPPRPPATPPSPKVLTRTARDPSPIKEPKRRDVDIVIPVYSGVEETLTCIRSVIATAQNLAEIIVIDDASPDRDMAAALAPLATAGAITLLHNPRNAGFPATANRGLALHPDRDVVLLNADTEVYGDWLTRLRAIAYSGNRIATVTPLTNSGSIATYPWSEDPALPSRLAADLDRLAANLNSESTIDMPTGVGFCLYMRRDSMNEVGYFDAETFSKGYGEENDFCLRATAAGWKHVLAAGIYVRHSGSRSFGGRRAALYERNLRLLNIRYPGYDAIIREYLKRDPAHHFRRRLDEERLICAGGGRVLFVSLGLDGGVDRAVRERLAALRELGIKTILLTPDLKNCGRSNLEIDEPGYDDLHYDFENEGRSLTSFLRKLKLDRIELHHFLDQPSDLIESLFDFGVPIDVKIHDYVWYCPRITLLDKSGRYCGEPDIKACQSCVDADGSRLKDNPTIGVLRKRSGKWLRAAREITVPSPSVARRMEAQFPNLKFRVEPLENDVPSPVRAKPQDKPADPVKIALIGAIGDHKGYEILLAMAKHTAKCNLPLEFVVIGFSKNDRALLKTGKVFITGRYEEAEVGGLIAREAPNVILFLSVFPESWSYSLTHALRANIPVAAFDLGAFADRLHGTPAADLLFPIPSGPASICERLLDVLQPTSRRDRNKIQPLSPESRSSRAPGKPDILSNAPTLPEAAKISRTTMAPTSTAPTASVSLLPLTTGLFLFSVRSTQPSQRIDDQGGIRLPAMQVGTAPGVPPQQVEFMTAPKTQSNWLSEPNDQIVAKVSAPSALIILTSVMIPGMMPLEIEVKRIDLPESAPAVAENAQASLSPPELSSQKSIRLKITPHVQNHGDVVFGESQWAGLVGQGFWIESFSVVPLEDIPPETVEYMAVTATGVETPWVSDGGSCGTRGIGVPLTGFAVRVKPELQDQGFTCEYGAILLSGAIAGPARDGVLCQAPNDGDPIGAIWISVGNQGGSAKSMPKRRRVMARPEIPASRPVQDLPGADPRPTKKKTPLGPRFSVFRESGKSE